VRRRGRTRCATLVCSSLVNDMTLNDQLLNAYTEFNDAAVAITTCQLAQATNAGQRLETARKRF
jgi:hypothetical protein